jgi:hypothetical protein
MCAINALACDELLKQKRFVKNKKHIYAKYEGKKKRQQQKSQIQSGLPE